MIPHEWMAQRRDDGEIVGYVEMIDDAFRPYDLLGRPLADAAGWESAESAIESAGLAFLAEAHLIDLDDPVGERRVRITEVTRGYVVLVADDFGAAQVVGAAALERWMLDLPLAVELRPQHSRPPNNGQPRHA